LFHAIDTYSQALAEDRFAERQAQLDGFLEHELKHFNTHRVCVTGDASSKIVEAARRWSADLVMMPVHGVGVVSRLHLGSVAAQVLSDLECPLWTSAHLYAAPSIEQIQCRRIVCAVDATERGKRILRWTTWMAGECRAALQIVHATHERPVSNHGKPVARSEWNRDEEFAEAAGHRKTPGTEVLQRERATTSRTFLRIAATVKDFDADLLVMGRHHGPVGDPPENPNDILRGSPCPIISV
jgi:nucleotide-binding universal stress UspA family protein